VIAPHSSLRSLALEPPRLASRRLDCVYLPEGSLERYKPAAEPIPARYDWPMKPIYLDYQASTPVDQRVLAKMLPLFTEDFGNPHSAQHQFGTTAAAHAEVARAQVAALIGARASEITFTSGATEANNTAILGVAKAYTGPRRELVVSAFEHPCVLASMACLEGEGFELKTAPIRSDGIIDLEALSKLITDATLLVSIMAANNEVGTVQPLAEIGALTAQAGAFLHTDAAQAAGKVPINVNVMGIDLLSLTAHKVYGPKGVGALYVKARPDLQVAPLIVGGGQEHGQRSGTVPVPLAAGLGEACAIAQVEMKTEAASLSALRERLFLRLAEQLPTIRRIGHEEQRLPGNINVCIPGLPAEQLLVKMPELALSSASACSAGGGVPSHVLGALGLEPEVAECCFRVGLGRATTESEIDRAADLIGTAARALHREVALT
jgi:cysteine desulfurase